MVTKKERIAPPKAADVKTASKQMTAGGAKAGPAGRVMADKSVAVRQGAAKSSKKK